MQLPSLTQFSRWHLEPESKLVNGLKKQRHSSSDQTPWDSSWALWHLCLCVCERETMHCMLGWRKYLFYMKTAHMSDARSNKQGRKKTTKYRLRNLPPTDSTPARRVWYLPSGEDVMDVAAGSDPPWKRAEGGGEGGARGVGGERREAWMRRESSSDVLTQESTRQENRVTHRKWPSSPQDKNTFCYLVSSVKPKQKKHQRKEKQKQRGGNCNIGTEFS